MIKPEAVRPATGTVVPHLVCSPCAEALEFYKKALGAEEASRVQAPDGKRIMHACLIIGKSHVFFCDDFAEFCGGKQSNPKALGGTSVTLHLNVENCDAAIKRAADAGATVTMPATDMFWGDRYGQVQDPFGHKWSFATHIKDLTPEEIKVAMNSAFAKGPK